MSNRETISLKVDADMKERIEAHQDRKGYEHRSSAARELLEVGVMETNGPILYRLKGLAIQTAYVLCLFGAVAYTIGQTTSVMTRPEGFRVLIVLVGFGLSMLAVVEAARTVRGQNQLSTMMSRSGANE